MHSGLEAYVSADIIASHETLHMGKRDFTAKVAASLVQEAAPSAFGPSLLAALCPVGRTAGGPLAALRIQGLSRSLDVLPAFASTLRHLMLPQLSWMIACGLHNIVLHLKALKVPGSPD